MQSVLSSNHRSYISWFRSAAAFSLLLFSAGVGDSLGSIVSMAHGECLRPFLLLPFYYMLPWTWTLVIDDLDAWVRHIPRRPSPYYPCPHILVQWMWPLCASPPLQIHHIYGDHAYSHSWRCKPRQVTWDICIWPSGSHCAALAVFSNINSYPLPLEMICRYIF